MLGQCWQYRLGGQSGVWAAQIARGTPSEVAVTLATVLSRQRLDTLTCLLGLLRKKYRYLSES